MKNKSPEKKSNDLLVFMTRSDGKCAECGDEFKCAECGDEFGSGRWIFLDEGKPLCMSCAGLDHLEYLPPGNATLTRRAGKHSPIRAVLLQWAGARKRYERQGTLVTSTYPPNTDDPAPTGQLSLVSWEAIGIQNASITATFSKIHVIYQQLFPRSFDCCPHRNLGNFATEGHVGYVAPQGAH